MENVGESRDKSFPAPKRAPGPFTGADLSLETNHGVSQYQVVYGCEFEDRTRIYTESAAFEKEVALAVNPASPSQD